MKITINIPEVFIAHWEMDRFKDSLLRMKADAESCEMWSENYEAELCEMLITAFQEAKEVPPRRRLIDADALTDNWYYASAAFRPDDVRKVVCLDDIDNAPTIIEAEEDNGKADNC